MPGKHFFEPWTWKMAWRDTRSSRRRLMVFSLSVVFGVAALVAIGCFRKSLEQSVDEQSRGLLGADLVVASRQAFSKEAEEVLQSMGGEQSREIDFTSMIYFPETQGTRLVQIRALEGGFPFYGSMEVTPPEAAKEFRTGGTGVLVEDTLLAQFNTRPGSEVRIGELKLRVLGSLHKVPGETVMMATIAPRVYIAFADLKQSRLIRQGSMARYKAYFKFGPATDVAAVVKKAKPDLDKMRLSFETVDKRKKSLGRSVENLYHFLNLVGFVALLLGGVGIANAVHVHIRQKLETVAVLRCLGASVSQTMAIYILQGLGLGLFGSLIGAILGIGLERLMPIVLSDFLPLQVPAVISWSAVGTGLGIGLLVALLFSLAPLAPVRKVSPLLAVRQSFEPRVRRWNDPFLWFAYIALAATVIGFSLAYTQKRAHGLFFAAGLVVTTTILLLLARGIMAVARRLSHLNIAYVWRQGIANLYRPNNRTSLLLLSIGLGTFLILTVYVVQHSLLGALEAEGYGKEGDTVLFDVQPDQRPVVTEIMKANGLALLDEAPIITMRLSSVKGRPVESLLTNKQSSIPHWVLRREYRSTYNDHLRSGEKLISGTWVAQFTNSGGTIPISAEQSIAHDLGVGLGDEVMFDVQGIPVKTKVASVREVDWRRVQPNFFIVFPKGSLEDAPGYFAMVTRSGTAERSAALQRQVVEKFPNISVIDLRLILQTVDTLLKKVSFVLQFMALFTAFTGLLVLIGAVLTGRYQRARESVLLRTLGASKRQIGSILLVEYLSLGVGAALTGTVLSLAASWALAHYVFQISFVPGITAAACAFVIVPLVTTIVGLLLSRDTVRHPPMEVLRSEAALQ
jgi:putative ABC transport system permease protein